MNENDETVGIVCEHPVEARQMRGWTEVCTLCGKGRDIR